MKQLTSLLNEFPFPSRQLEQFKAYYQELDSLDSLEINSKLQLMIPEINKPTPYYE